MTCERSQLSWHIESGEQYRFYYDLSIGIRVISSGTQLYRDMLDGKNNFESATELLIYNNEKLTRQRSTGDPSPTE